MSLITENIMFYIRIDVFQQRLAEHIQVARLHCVVGYIKNEEVNSRLWWPQLGLNRGGTCVKVNKNITLHSHTQICVQMNTYCDYINLFYEIIVSFSLLRIHFNVRSAVETYHVF